MARLAKALKAYTKNPAIGAAAAIKPKILSAPAPAASVAPPPPAPTAMPWDANYEARVGGINRDTTNSLAGLDREQADVKQAYGFDDVSNPFSRLKMLQKSFSESKAGNLNGFAAMGLGHSSAFDSAAKETQHGYDSNHDGLRRSYDADLSSIATRRAGVKSASEDAITGADWDRTQSALAGRPDPASVPAAEAAAAPKPYTERPGTNRRGEKGVWHDYKDGRKPVFVRKP